MSYRVQVRGWKEQEQVEKLLLTFHQEMHGRNYKKPDSFSQEGLKVRSLKKRRAKTYTDQDRNINADTSVSKNVTMFMCTPITDRYSSPSLFEKLQSTKTNAIGSVRWNKKNMPKELAATKLKRSDMISRSSNEMMEVEKKRWKNNNTPVTKPDIALENNDGMGGVDL
ncbi:PREDICTED: uncharacterized protein LOC108545557 [Eufriesea mexicana]|uniref:uncharacterized protein LOC108545557 n=1 Tax=Eufriesea mexicana TaxID=516756 RepID=UPI00083C5CA7|nr:PREDICTED: uncharacterized protein LOC108545557 [Eufriesea mexicana]